MEETTCLTTRVPPPFRSRPGGTARSELNATIRKAEGGDKAALAEVRGLFAHPGTAAILGGDVAAEAVKVLVSRYAAKSPVMREAVTHKLEELRAELSGPSPNPLERLLVERVVATWLHLHHLEVGYGNRESVPLDVGAYYQKAISAAQKRYLAAIKGLAEVRKLALPVLQVNIARKQVNVAASTIAGAPAN